MHTSLGEAAITTYMKVDKADGRVLFFRVEGEDHTEITQTEYEENQ